MTLRKFSLFFMRAEDFTIFVDGGNMRRLWKKICFFSKDMGRQNLSAFSASTAFFFFLSLVPMLIMLCTIIPYTPLTEDNDGDAGTDSGKDLSVGRGLGERRL